MAPQTMGEMISALRKEKGMTQRELAQLLHMTDKAVSKWERGAACPDTQTIPRLAEILGISIEELMTAKPAPEISRKGAGRLVNLILRAIPAAMGVAVAVTGMMGEIDMKSGFSMLGIGLACAGIYLLNDHS